MPKPPTPESQNYLLLCWVRGLGTAFFYTLCLPNRHRQQWLIDDQHIRLKLWTSLRNSHQQLYKRLWTGLTLGSRHQQLMAGNFGDLWNSFHYCAVSQCVAHKSKAKVEIQKYPRPFYTLIFITTSSGFLRKVDQESILFPRLLNRGCTTRGMMFLTHVRVLRTDEGFWWGSFKPCTWHIGMGLCQLCISKYSSVGMARVREYFYSLICTAVSKLFGCVCLCKRYWWTSLQTVLQICSWMCFIFYYFFFLSGISLCFRIFGLHFRILDDPRLNLQTDFLKIWSQFIVC